MTTTAQCEICRAEYPLSALYDGWGGLVCADNADCRSPSCYAPRRRKVAALTAGILDGLEWQADESARTLMAPEVDHAVLRALIDAARAALDSEARRLAREARTASYERYGGPDWRFGDSVPPVTADSDEHPAHDAAPIAIADLPDWWDARRARLGKPDKSSCAAELRAALSHVEALEQRSVIRGFAKKRRP